MLIRNLAIACLFCIPSLAVAREVKSETIPGNQVPGKVSKAADEVLGRCRWGEYARMTADSGSPRVWYVLTGSQQLTAPRQKILSDGDVEEIPGEFRDVMIRILPDGEVIDAWLDVVPDNLPAEVKAALQRQSPGAKAESSCEIRQGQNSKIYCYHVVIKSGNGAMAFNISPDGTKVERKR